MPWLGGGVNNGAAAACNPINRLRILFIMETIFYPAQFTPAEKGGYVVTFLDIPETMTCGDDLTHAREMAADALLTATDFYFEDARAVPPPSDIQAGEEWGDCPPISLPKY